MLTNLLREKDNTFQFTVGDKIIQRKAVESDAITFQLSPSPPHRSSLSIRNPFVFSNSEKQLMR